MKFLAVKQTAGLLSYRGNPGGSKRNFESLGMKKTYKNGGWQVNRYLGLLGIPNDWLNVLLAEVLKDDVWMGCERGSKGIKMNVGIICEKYLDSKCINLD